MQENGHGTQEITRRRRPAFVARFVFRMPITLHRDLTARAEIEGVSLNQFLLYLVAAGLNHWDPKAVRYQMLRAAAKRMDMTANYESERYQKD
jgi:hypothetical protein